MKYENALALAKTHGSCTRYDDGLVIAGVGLHDAVIFRSAPDGGVRRVSHIRHDQATGKPEITRCRSVTAAFRLALGGR